MTYEQKSQINSDTESPEMITLNDQTEQKISPDTQRYLTDSDPLDMMYYCAFGGWRKKYKTVVTHHIGGDQTEMQEEWIVDYSNRSINESGCNYLANAVRALISAVTVTGSLDKITLYNLWATKSITMRYNLLMSAYVGMKKCSGKSCGITYDLDYEACIKCGSNKSTIIKNPFQLNTNNIDDIMTTVLTLYAVSSNAKDGFKMTKFVDTFITSNIIKNGGVPERKEGIIDRIQKGFK